MASVEALLAVPLKLKFVSKPSPRPMRLGGIRPGTSPKVQNSDIT